MRPFVRRLKTTFKPRFNHLQRRFWSQLGRFSCKYVVKFLCLSCYSVHKVSGNGTREFCGKEQIYVSFLFVFASTYFSLSQTHWHSFFVLSDIGSTMVLGGSLGGILKKTPLAPTILPLSTNKDDVFRWVFIKKFFDNKLIRK